MSDSSATRLSADILKYVFSYCRKEGTRECMYVCKSWHLAAKRKLYDEVVIPDEDSALRFISALAISNSGVYVRHLAFTQEVEPDRREAFPVSSPTDIESLLKACPNILSIDSDICNPYYLLRSLNTGQNNFMNQNYLSQFRLLKHLTINQSTNAFINFTNILSSLPRLESLDYIGNSTSLGIRYRDVLDSDRIKYLNLTVLSLYVLDASRDDLDFISNSLPSLNTVITSPTNIERFNNYFPNANVLALPGPP